MKNFPRVWEEQKISINIIWKHSSSCPIASKNNLFQKLANSKNIARQFHIINLVHRKFLIKYLYAIKTAGKNVKISIADLIVALAEYASHHQQNIFDSHSFTAYISWFDPTHCERKSPVPISEFQAPLSVAEQKFPKRERAFSNIIGVWNLSILWATRKVS